MGNCCCSHQVVQATEEPVFIQNPIQSEVPPEIPCEFPTPLPREYGRDFWATPVFIYNSTLPPMKYVYTQVHPVEPFCAQRYTIQKR